MKPYGEIGETIREIDVMGREFRFRAMIPTYLSKQDNVLNTSTKFQ